MADLHDLYSIIWREAANVEGEQDLSAYDIGWMKKLSARFIEPNSTIDSDFMYH